MPPVLTFLFTWQFNAVGIIVIVIAGLLYGLGLARLRRAGVRWPFHRTLIFYVLGLGSYGWVTCGFLGTWSIDLRWAFTTRIALLVFAVPALISYGKPVALAKLALNERHRRVLDRFLNSRLLRISGNAVFEPLFTLGLFLVFLTPLAGTLRANAGIQGWIDLLIPVIGLLMVLPIIENTITHTGFFITFEFMLAFAALVFDAIPGILLRLSGTVFDNAAPVIGALPVWFPNPLHDQHLSGDFLWFLAEIADIPVLIVLFIRWSKTDRREARSMDELSDEEMDKLTQAHLRGSFRDES